MTQEEMLRMMRNGMGGGQQQIVPEPVEKLDKFIDEILENFDETEYSLAQTLNLRLQRSPMLSYTEVEVLPQILQRIQQRSQGGK